MYVIKEDLVHFCLEDLNYIIQLQEARMSAVLRWPLGFKVGKMWFLVFTGKKGEDRK